MAGPKAVTSEAAERWQWKVESAADTLQEAEEIKTDKKLLAAAKKELGKRQKAVATVLGKLGAAVMRNKGR